ncbi:MAG: phosphatidate cytidylyltransferase [Pseudomonadota bacterium]
MKRFISGVVLVALFLASLALGNIAIDILLLVVAILMLQEWYNMTQSDVRFLLLGLPIVAIPIASLILISMIPDGKMALLLFTSIIISVDTFAMIGGKLLGGPKLAPKISPRKTWSGLISGAAAGGIASAVVAFLYTMQFEYWQFLLFGIMMGLIEQSSDLFVSFFKRKFNIKDSGSIIPGHGGVLDRFDGIILTAPIFLYTFLQCTQN